MQYVIRATASIRRGKDIVSKTFFFHDEKMVQFHSATASKFSTKDEADAKIKTLNSTSYMGLSDWERQLFG